MSSTVVTEPLRRRPSARVIQDGDRPQAKAGVPDAVEPSSNTSSSTTFALVLVCFVLSGFAALLYETAWLRQFAIVFGTSELALAAVLGAYMAGLALGSAVAGRFVSRVRRPVLVYGLLELGIGVGALLVPVGLTLVRQVHVAWLGGQPEPPDSGALTQVLFYLVCSFCIILVPTSLMGATLPMLARHAIHRFEHIGSRVGLLYAMNTAGAVAGTLTAAYCLLPALGLQATVFVGVAVNALVFAIAAWIARRSEFRNTSHNEATGPAREVPRLEEYCSAEDDGIDDSDPHALAVAARREGDINQRAGWILPIIAISGMVSFTYEVLWTRLLGHILGGSLYAFAAMLAAFLMGITLGSVIASRWACSRTQAVLGFSIAQLGTAFLSFTIYHCLDRIPAMARWLESGEHAGFFSNSAIAIAVLLPATLFIGATFPFAVRLLARHTEDASLATARVYAWNTVGAIVGAILAGLLFLPTLAFSGTAILAISMNILLALAMCVVFRRVSWKPLYGVGVIALAVILFPPQRPDSILRMSPFTNTPAEGRTVYSSAGRSTTVLMLEKDGFFTMRNNGLPEAGIAPRGTPPGSWESHRWLSALPVLARPDAKSMLVVGLGGGVTVASVPSTVKTIDVIELESDVVDANKAIAQLRIKDPLSDPRVRVVLNDARSALSLTTKQYDVIVSQPSHPWTSGASHLYTREFLGQVRDHLNPDGVLLQWMNAEMLDESLMKTVGATLLDAFRHVRLYRPDPETMLFLASNEPLRVESQLVRTGEPLAASPSEYHWLGINGVNDVAAALALECDGVRILCARAPVNTDNHNRLATRAPNVLGQLSGEDMDKLLAPLDPLLDLDSELNLDPEIELDRVYLVRRLALMHMWLRAEQVAKKADDYAVELLARGLVYSKAGDQAAATKAFEQSFALNPNDDNTRFKLIEGSLTQIAMGTASPNMMAIASGLKGPVGALIAASQCHYRDDMRGLSRLDGYLSQVKPTDLCFPLATYFRALWRTKVTASHLRVPCGREALDLVDRGLACNPSVFGALVRINAAAAANQPDVFVESADYAARLFESQDASPRTIESASSLVLNGINAMGDDDRVPAHRLKQVKTRFLHLLADLDAATP